MKNLSVSRKIMASVGVLIAAFFAFGIYVNYAVRQINASTEVMGTLVQHEIYVSELKDGANLMRRLSVDRVDAQNAQEAPQMAARIDNTIKELHDNADRYHELQQKADVPAERKTKILAVCEQEEQAMQAYLDTDQKIDDYLAKGDRAAAAVFVMQGQRAAFDAYYKLMTADADDAQQQIEIIQARAAAVYHQTVLVIVLATLALLLLAGAVLYKLVHDIKKAVAEVLSAAEDIAGGDLTRRVQIVSQDEFGQIARKLNEMAEKVAATIHGVQSVASEVAAASEELNANSNQSADATQSIAQSITKVAGSATDQLQAVDQNQQNVSFLAEGIKQTTTIIDTVTQEIVAASGRTEEGGSFVDHTVQQMDAIVQATEESAALVTDLGERSKEIGAIVDTIAAIAEQTNLLALNASIEAARAGEHGRGFTVVADNVRKLAEQSQASTERIASLIHDIQAATDKAVASMQAGRERVEKGRDDVQATGDSFSGIRTSVETVHSKAGAITAMMSELQEHVQSIVASSSSINDAAKKVGGESQTVSAAAEEQSAGMEEIASSSQSLARLAEQLQEAVEKFKV